MNGCFHLYSTKEKNTTGLQKINYQKIHGFNHDFFTLISCCNLFHITEHLNEAHSSLLLCCNLEPMTY